MCFPMANKYATVDSANIPKTRAYQEIIYWGSTRQNENPGELLPRIDHQ